MATPVLILPQRISLRSSTKYNEAFIQKAIADNSSLLGLGDLELIGKERIQAKGGRLDFLFRDSNGRRYTVELQLGPTDPSHIIRAIEYWDVERKLYRKHDYCAVIIAEELTGRFYNVISLFNGVLPLIALQINAYEVDDKLLLVFSKVLDEIPATFDDEDVKVVEITRKDWVDKSSENSVSMAEKILAMFNEIDPDFKLNFTKAYIGIAKNGIADNFLIMNPSRRALRVAIRLGELQEVSELIDKAGFDILPYENRFKQYRLNLTKEDLTTRREAIKDLLQRSYDERQ